MKRTLLITGFGPFPGMPFNPTGPLVRRLASMRRPALADWRIASHVFQTSYAAVDDDLPALIAQHRPDALLMFGVAGRTRHIRIETLARNRLTRILPDVSGKLTARGVIMRNAPAAIAMRAPAMRLLAAARTTRLPVKLSNDAGRYLCNYLCWRAAETLAAGNAPRLAAFVHVPKVRRTPGRLTRRKHPVKRPMMTLDDLVRAGESILVALTAATARR
jgi:pyroglutamyl-peptidase